MTLYTAPMKIIVSLPTGATHEVTGKPKTSVTLTLSRKGETRPIVVVLTRDVIRPQVARFRLEGGDVASGGRVDEAEQALAAVARRLAGVVAILCTDVDGGILGHLAAPEDRIELLGPIDCKPES